MLASFLSLLSIIIFKILTFLLQNYLKSQVTSVSQCRPILRICLLENKIKCLFKYNIKHFFFQFFETEFFAQKNLENTQFTLGKIYYKNLLVQNNQGF